MLSVYSLYGNQRDYLCDFRLEFKVIKRTLRIVFQAFLFLCATQCFAGPDQDFLLGAGDSIHIAVYRNPELTLDIRVSADGTISFPLLQSVKVGGLRIAEAESLIAKGLQNGGYIQDPQVNITLIVARANSVTILGQVNRPGMYPIENSNLHLTEALALAGGIVMSTAITGSMPGGDKVILKGTRDGKLFIKEITLSSIYLDKNVDDDVIIMPRDEIYVPFLMFFIYGEVQRAGSYPVFSEMTVMQALAQGGGLTPRGTQRNITLFRRDKSTGIVEKTHPLMTDVIQQNDVILVPESLF